MFIESITFALKETGKVVKAAPDIQHLSISYSGSVQSGTGGGRRDSAAHTLTLVAFEAPFSQLPVATPENHRLLKLCHDLSTKLAGTLGTWMSGNGHLLTA